MENKIIRFFDTELRSVDSDDEIMSVVGYALKFNKETFIGDKKWGWKEKIARTALDDADMDNVIFNFNHSYDNVMARTNNDSLKLEIDNIGLKITANIVDTSVGRDVYKLIQNGIVTKMSFAAIVEKSEWIFAEDNSTQTDEREIKKFKRLFDVSAVTFPAYDDTSIMARSLTLERKAKEQLIYERQIQRINEIMS